MSRTMFSRSVVSLMFAWVLVLSTIAKAQVPCEVTELSASDDPVGLNAFGERVAVSGDYIVLGAHADGKTQTGAAYVFKNINSQWLEQVKLFWSAVGFNANFGWSWGLKLLSYGREGAEQTVAAPSRIEADGRRVSYSWDETLTEWYVNDRRGLEHGYTIQRRGVHSERERPVTVAGAAKLLQGRFTGTFRGKAGDLSHSPVSDEFEVSILEKGKEYHEPSDSAFRATFTSSGFSRNDSGSESG